MCAVGTPAGIGRRQDSATVRRTATRTKFVDAAPRPEIRNADVAEGLQITEAPLVHDGVDHAPDVGLQTLPGKSGNHFEIPGARFGSLYSKDYSMLGSVLGPFIYRNLQITTRTISTSTTQSRDGIRC